VIASLAEPLELAAKLWDADSDEEAEEVALGEHDALDVAIKHADGDSGWLGVHDTVTEAVEVVVALEEVLIDADDDFV